MPPASFLVSELANLDPPVSGRGIANFRPCRTPRHLSSLIEIKGFFSGWWEKRGMRVAAVLAAMRRIL
jgi:hypothetical protein